MKTGDIRFYMAPLEGITGTVFRNAVFKVFGDCVDKYFAPFIVPHSKRSMTNKELWELAPGNNSEIYLVPQILTKYAGNFHDTAEKLMDMGYGEINLNLGCPSPIVVPKGRGAGMLKEPDKVDELLYGIFERNKCKVSVKTRTGFGDPDEFPALLEVFNKYEMEELIIHCRVGTQKYSGTADRETFKYALMNSRNPLCYNGDIYTAGDLDTLLGEISGMDSQAGLRAVMAGRGAAADPSLIRQLKGGKKASAKELEEFFDELVRGYRNTPLDDKQILAKLKELWTYTGVRTGCEKNVYKAMLKTSDLRRFLEIFTEQVLPEYEASGE